MRFPMFAAWRATATSVALALAALPLTATLASAADIAPILMPEEAANAHIAAADATATPSKQGEHHDDYYARRARETLARESAANPKPHDLQLAHPDSLVVVCEAGCSRDNEPEIVAIEPIPRASAETGARMEPTSISLAKSQVIACEAGCYATPKAYAAPAQPVAETLRKAVVEQAASPSLPLKRKREPFSPVR